MSTAAQFAANQANAAHSTGPRTDEGKSKTRGNATRHGLCATVPSGEDQGIFDSMHNDLIAEYQPATPTEEILVFKMAVNFFSFVNAENLLAERLAVNQSEDDSKQVALMMRYQSTADRHFNRNLSDLRKIQKERRCPHVQPDAATYPSAACSEAQRLILPTSDVQREDTGQEPRAIERDRSIGSVSQKAAAQPAEPPHFAQKTAVCVTAAPLHNPKTAQVSPPKAA
jgi:hypothetical protein